MEIFQYNSSLTDRIEHWKEQGQQIAFVPTMGALHEGHLSLIDIAKSKARIAVCSIFVNPTQFNDSSDLDEYPRPIEQDIRKLIDRGCDVLYFPSTEEVYPAGLNTIVKIDLAGMDQRLEGKFRPGHFDGMLQVVKRLLDLVQPDFLIMGQKDYQQFQIVSKMIHALSLPVQLVVAPIMRETSGLAMSSRNNRLSVEARKNASVIYRSLLSIKENFGSVTNSILLSHAESMLTNAGFRVEYIELIREGDLMSVEEGDETDSVVVCVAAWLDNIRLIDNVIIK